jgi:branched-chain amino acid aminotransferase
MFVHLNGKLVPAQDASVSVFDHGFLYGDGIYETMRGYNRVIFMLDEHLKRLYRSASLIGLPIPWGKDNLRIALYETLLANNLNDAYLRLTVTRGRGPVGLDPGLCPEPTVVIIAHELKPYPESFYKKGIALMIARTRRNLREAIDPAIKSLNFLNNILAKIEAKKAGAYEAIMLNARGNLAEGTISNLFFFSDGILCTPSAECGILDGITRGLILQLAARLGFRVREGEFRRGALYSSDEVFVTNTTFEVMPVTRADKKEYAVGKKTRLLHKAYRKEVSAYVANIKAGMHLSGND